MNIGLAIQSIRKELQIAQYELAKKCGISQTSLSQIENGIKSPSSKTISKICAALDIPEPIIYILAMQETDISEGKRSVYRLLHPSLLNLALKMVNMEEIAEKKEEVSVIV